MEHTLHKQERLRGKLVVQRLFAEGKAFTCYPLRVVYKHNASCEQKVLFSVPKKRFKRAVDRNRIKRLMRESYRLNKELLSGCDGGFEVAFVSISDAVPSFEFMQKKMCEALMLLKEKE